MAQSLGGAVLTAGHLPGPIRQTRTTVRPMTVHGMQHEASVDIAATPEAVYDLVSDVPRMGEWSPENVGADWTSGTPGVQGATFEGHNRLGDREWSVPCTVSQAQVGECFEWETRPDDPEGPYVRWTYRMAANDQGGTTLTEIWDVLSLPPTLQPLSAEQLAARAEVVRAGMAETLAAIKATAES